MKRILSLILCCSLLVSSLPLQILATQTEETTLPMEVVTEPVEETIAPAEAVTESVEETAVPTEVVAEPEDEIFSPTEDETAETAEENIQTEPALMAVVESGTCGSTMTWAFDSANGTLTISGTGNMYNFFYLDDWVPENCPWLHLTDMIITVVVESGVTSIGDDAFGGCTKLKNVYLPLTVTKIGYDAFNQYHCSTFTLHYEGTQEQWASVNIGSEYTSRLKSCAKVYSSIYIPSEDEEVKLLYSGTCGEKTEWTLDSNGLLSIFGSGPMANFTSSDIPWNKYGSDYDAMITKVVVCNGVTSVGDYAFYQCHNLTYVDIADSVTYIGQSAFYQCRTLEHLVLSQSLKQIGASAFAETLIQNITIPASCESIDYGAFNGCYELKMLTLSEGLTSIGENAFRGCIRVASVTIPASVFSVGDGAFSWCDSLSGIQVAPESVGYIGVDGVLFTSDEKVLVQFPGGHSATTYNIPFGVKEISPCAFADCDRLTTVIIPSSVKLIGNSAFNDADGLNSLSIPDGISTVPQQMLYECYGLSSLYIPASVENFGLWAMKNCGNLADIYFGGTQEQWKATGAELPHKYVNMHYNWVANVTGTCGDNLTWNFNTGNGTMTISGTGDMYNYDDVNQLPYAVYLRNIRNVVIEDGATSIGDYAFRLCTAMETIVIPNTVTTIGAYAFQSCSGLKKITLPVSITSIGDSAFSACTELANFNVPTKTVSIGKEAFAYTNLKTITIPGTVTSIGQDIFRNVKSLTDVFYDDYLAAWDCLRVTLPEGVALHYVYTAQEQAWIDAHMDYIFSKKYTTDIISGYDSWMLELFREAQDDGGILAYNLPKTVSKALSLDFTLSGIETYEVLLSQILYDRTSLNFAYATYEQGLCGAMVYLAGIYKSWSEVPDNASKIPTAVRTSIKELYSTITSSTSSAREIADSSRKIVSLIDDHLSMADLKVAFKSEGIFFLMGITTDLLFELFDTLEDITCYIENYMAYQYTSRYFKTALQTLAVTIYDRYGSENGFLETNPFNELGGIKSQLNWLELNTALYNFIDALEAYEQEGADSVARYAVERVKEAGANFTDSAIRSTLVFAMDLALMQVPILNLLVVGKNLMNIGLLGVELLTNVDDRKAALDMMTKVYCLSVMLDESIETCAGTVDYSNYEATMVFDESVQIYACTQKIGWQYAEKYAHLRLADAIEDLEDYTEDNDNIKEKKFLKLNLEVNRFLGYLSLLENQLYDLSHIACHDANTQYVEDPADHSSEFSDARAYVVACPVSVTVTNSQGKRMALLTDNGSQVEEGYELFFQTIPLNDGSGQHIKVAIVPENYSVSIEGTDQGTMNAFVTDYKGESNDVSMYLDVPVEKGSKGSFTEKPEEPEILELIMNQTTHNPLVSVVQPGDVDLDGQIGSMDALYLFWNNLFPEEYPVTADADFNADGVCNNDDAVILLWHLLFPEQYPLQ